MNAKEILLSVKKLLEPYKLSNVQLTDHSLIQFQGDTLKNGIPVYLLIDSKPSPLPDGNYQTLDGSKFTISKGVASKVENVKPVAKAPVEQAQSSQAPYGSVDYADPGLQKDKVKRYPLDTDAHIKNAWARINQDQDSSQYSPEDLQKVKDKIESAMKKIDPKFDPKQKHGAAPDIKDEEGKRTSPAGSEDAIDEEEDSADDSDTSTDTPLTVESLMTALQPLLDSIKSIESKMSGDMTKHTAMSKELNETKEELKDTRKALELVSEVVDTIAAKPSAKPIEVMKNPFKKADVDVTTTRAYQIMHAAEKSKVK